MARLGAVAAVAAGLVLSAAVILPGAAAPAVPRVACEAAFPPATINGQTLLELSCSRSFQDVVLTLPRPATTLSKYAVVNGTSLAIGTCSGEGTRTATCHLGTAFRSGSELLLQWAPSSRINDRLALLLKGGRPASTVKQTIVAVAGPKLTVTSTVTPDSASSAPPGTAFDFSEKVSGGPFYKLEFRLPPGNSVLTSLAQPTNGLQCGASTGASFTCFEQGTKPIPAGTFQFAIELTQPVADGTPTSMRVWVNGLRQQAFTLRW